MIYLLIGMKSETAAAQPGRPRALGPRVCGFLFRKRFTQHLRCKRPFHESWHKRVHDAVHPARNDPGPVFPHRVKALGYALLHAHRLHRHGPRVEPKLVASTGVFVSGGGTTVT